MQTKQTGWDFFCPVEIAILEQAAALERVGHFLEGGKTVLLLAGKRRLDALGLTGWAEALEKQCACIRVDSIPSNPGVEDLSRCLGGIGRRKVDLIVAIGGGSCIDLAKGISAFHNCPGLDKTEDGIREAILDKRYTANDSWIPIIALPTTAGTGSEVTKWATVWDKAHGRKLSIEDNRLYPHAALIVPEHTRPMPPRLTLSTGLDALSHACEAYWANARTPLSQALALTAAAKIKDSLPRVLSDLDNLPYRKEMCLASLLAGLSFSITKTTACHSISYPLTMLFSIDHGFAAAMTLAEVSRRNRQAVPEIEALWDVFGGYRAFQAFIGAVSDPIQPLKLSAFHADREQIPKACEMAFTHGRMDNNPVFLTESSVRDILEACY